MSQEADLSCFDAPEVLEIIFPLVYSPMYSPGFTLFPSENPDYFIDVASDVKIGCEFWAESKDFPTILFFHGNGETAANYEPIAPLYTSLGINLFVADFRGYGASTGSPTVSIMLKDAQTIYKGFREILKKEGFTDKVFVMGRSLGSMSAIEIVTHHSEIKGLIIESGSANNFRRLCRNLGIDLSETLFSDKSPFLNKVKIRAASVATLIIHGEWDELVPLEEGKELFRSSGAKDKRMVVIPGAGHNDIMMVDEKLYFDSIKQFIDSHT